MEIRILLDRDIEGYDVYIEIGLRETGWDQVFTFEFNRLRDFSLPDDHPDQEIWRFVQHERLLLITSNRNDEDETSLQATLERENMPDSLPIITVSDKESLALAEYRQRVANRLAEIIADLEDYLGTGRIWVP
jgi:hypothetical protein